MATRTCWIVVLATSATLTVGCGSETSPSSAPSEEHASTVPAVTDTEPLFSGIDDQSDTTASADHGDAEPSEPSVPGRNAAPSPSTTQPGTSSAADAEPSAPSAGLVAVWDMCYDTEVRLLDETSGAELGTLGLRGTGSKSNFSRRSVKRCGGDFTPQ